MESSKIQEPDPTNGDCAATQTQTSMQSSMQPTGNNGLGQQPSSRKQRRDAVNKIPYFKIKDPSEMLGDMDDLEDEHQEDQQFTAKEYAMRLKHTKHTTSHNHMPPPVPSSIKVKNRNSNDSQGLSTVPGLTVSMDMSMTELTADQQLSLVKTCVKNNVFSKFKFYDREYDAAYNTDPDTLCGFVLKHTNIRGDRNWWVEMKRHVVKTHTDLRNNAIKNMQTKFKGKQALFSNLWPHGIPQSCSPHPDYPAKITSI